MEADKKGLENVQIKQKKAGPNRIFKLREMRYLHSLTRQEVFSYIHRLHKFIRKTDKKLRKYKHKLKKFLRSSGGIPPESTEKNAETKATDSTTSFIDEIRQAAENAQNENGFLYEPTSGLYYDQKTGYYYNAEYGLYYDGNNGCYYKYDQQKNEFIFHSQIQTDKLDKVDECDANMFSNKDTLDISNSKDEQVKRRRREKQTASDSDDGREDGEISSDGDNSIVCLDGIDLNEDVNADNDDEEITDIAEKYPPSLRIIVQETNIPSLQTGTLYIITFKGGTLGREGNHDVLIPDLNVSKYHNRFSYNEEKGTYQCVDLGSRNGTLLNGKRMSNAKQESELFDIQHGSILQVSQTKLLCHIHIGNRTCGHCEPGLIMEQKGIELAAPLSHKEQLKKLQKRYGLENDRFVDRKADLKYADRAFERRSNVGSTNDCEKTQFATTNTEISCENRGFRMLSKLGWNKGETLGKHNSGLLVPINVSSRRTPGMGCADASIAVPITSSENYMKKIKSWQKTRERYKILKPVKADIFAESSSEDENAAEKKKS